MARSIERTFCIYVRGRSGARFSFNFTGDLGHLKGWRFEGLEIDEVCNTIPVWAQQLGLTWAWCRAQDAWQWLRMW